MRSYRIGDLERESDLPFPRRTPVPRARSGFLPCSQLSFGTGVDELLVVDGKRLFPSKDPRIDQHSGGRRGGESYLALSSHSHSLPHW